MHGQPMPLSLKLPKMSFVCNIFALSMYPFILDLDFYLEQWSPNLLRLVCTFIVCNAWKSGFLVILRSAVAQLVEC